MKVLLEWDEQANANGYFFAAVACNARSGRVEAVFQTFLSEVSLARLAVDQARELWSGGDLTDVKWRRERLVRLWQREEARRRR